jgi:hypothetical protein
MKTACGVCVCVCVYVCVCVSYMNQSIDLQESLYKKYVIWGYPNLVLLKFLLSAITWLMGKRLRRNSSWNEIKDEQFGNEVGNTHTNNYMLNFPCRPSVKNKSKMRTMRLLVFMYSTRYSCQWTRNFVSDFGKIHKYKISRKPVQWEPSCSMRTDRQTYIQTWQS